MPPPLSPAAIESLGRGARVFGVIVGLLLIIAGLLVEMAAAPVGILLIALTFTPVSKRLPPTPDPASLIITVKQVDTAQYRYREACERWAPE